MGGASCNSECTKNLPAEPLSRLLKSLRFSVQNFLYHIQLFVVRFASKENDHHEREAN